MTPASIIQSWPPCNHVMMTLSNGNFFLSYRPFVWGIHRSPVDSPNKGQWRRALMFSLICAWTNSLANNRDVSDLRCHCAHYDVTVMSVSISLKTITLRLDAYMSQWSRSSLVLAMACLMVHQESLAQNNGLSHLRNADLLSTGPLGTQSNEIRTEIQMFSFEKMYLKKSTHVSHFVYVHTCWPFCLCPHMLAILFMSTYVGHFVYVHKYWPFCLCPQMLAILFLSTNIDHFVYASMHLYQQKYDHGK